MSVLGLGGLDSISRFVWNTHHCGQHGGGQYQMDALHDEQFAWSL